MHGASSPAPSSYRQQKQANDAQGRGNVHHNSLRPILQPKQHLFIADRTLPSKCPNYSKEKKRNIIMSSKLSLNANGEYNLVEWGVAVYHEKRIKTKNAPNIFSFILSASEPRSQEYLPQAKDLSGALRGKRAARSRSITRRRGMRAKCSTRVATGCSRRGALTG